MMMRCNICQATTDWERQPKNSSLGEMLTASSRDAQRMHNLRNDTKETERQGSHHTDIQGSQQRGIQRSRWAMLDYISAIGEYAQRKVRTLFFFIVKLRATHARLLYCAKQHRKRRNRLSSLQRTLPTAVAATRSKRLVEMLSYEIITSISSF